MGPEEEATAREFGRIEDERLGEGRRNPSRTPRRCA